MANSCCGGDTANTASVALDADRLRGQVRTSYAQVATASDAGQGCGVSTGCCGVDEDGA